MQLKQIMSKAAAARVKIGQSAACYPAQSKAARLDFVDD
jgi:hypothetical protein